MVASHVTGSLGGPVSDARAQGRKACDQPPLCTPPPTDRFPWLLGKYLPGAKRLAVGCVVLARSAVPCGSEDHQDIRRVHLLPASPQRAAIGCILMRSPEPIKPAM